MKRKRLDRDAWGFQYYPYYQMRLDCPEFHGLVCLIRLTDGEKNFWEMPKAGKIQVTGGGMTWLQLIPDGEKRVITVMYFPDGSRGEEREDYPGAADARYQPSVWYVDVIESSGFDEDGVAVFVDKYVDVIFTPEGDVKVDDMDELEAALESGDVSEEQYRAALDERDRILAGLCRDIKETDRLCAAIRDAAEKTIAAGYAKKINK